MIRFEIKKDCRNFLFIRCGDPRNKTKKIPWEKKKNKNKKLIDNKKWVNENEKFDDFCDCRFHYYHHCSEEKSY